MTILRVLHEQHQHRRRGFTLLEISTALALVAVFSLIAFPTWRSVERSAADRVARLSLVSLEPEVARVQIGSTGGVTSDLAALMKVGGVEFVNGTVAVIEEHVVSADALAGSTNRAVLTTLSASGACWIMATASDTEPSWAVDYQPEPGTCRASNPAINTSSVFGTESAPSEIHLSSL